MNARPAGTASRRTLVVVGLGNIGSQTIPLLAHLPGLRRVILVDRDVYEAGNLATQAITRADVGRPKAQAQARRLRRLNSQLQVEAIVADVAALPPGRLQADLVLAGLDSLAARLALGESLWRLGVPWFDAGIDPARRLVRVTGYRPGESAACPWCGLDDAEYRSLGGRQPCFGGPAPTLATNGPACLGALAAALLVAEAQRFLDGADPAGSLFGRQAIADLAHHRLTVSALRRDPGCRFDHAVWQPRGRRIDMGMTLDALLLAGNGAAPRSVSFGRPLALKLRCTRCSHAVGRPTLVGREPLRCPACGRGSLRGSGFSMLFELDATAPAGVRRRPLRALGVRPGDLLRMTDARQRTTTFVVGDARKCEDGKVLRESDAHRQGLAQDTRREPGANAHARADH